MKKFKKFEIEKSELIFGGELIPTVTYGPTGEGRDTYDTETGTINHLELWWIEFKEK